MACCFGTFAKLSARVTNIKHVFICSASLTALNKALELACGLMAGSGQRIGEQWGVGEQPPASAWEHRMGLYALDLPVTSTWEHPSHLLKATDCHSVLSAWGLHLVGLVLPLSCDEEPTVWSDGGCALGKTLIHNLGYTHPVGGSEGLPGSQDFFSGSGWTSWSPGWNCFHDFCFFQMFP